MNSTDLRNLLILLICASNFLYTSCQHRPEPLTEKDKPFAPSNLVYSPNNIQLEYGLNGNSVVPKVEGTMPIRYTFATNPSHLGNMSIDSNGVLRTTSTLDTGKYLVTITATNTAGATSFSNVYELQVVKTALPASRLNYSTGTINIFYGDSARSVTPAIEGTGPFTYTIQSSANSADKIVIDQNGVITVRPGLDIGTYDINVSTTNTVGTVNFANAFKIVVKEIPPSGLVYSPNSLSLVVGNTASSASPTIVGTLPISYKLDVAPSTQKISINATSGVISVLNGLTDGTYNITVTAANEAGEIAFPNVYKVIMSASATAPSNLVYTANSLTVTEGISASSSTPTISGTTPISYVMTSNPASGGISINSTTGIITTSANATGGKYLVSVAATNSAGTTNFSNVFTINIEGKQPPSNLNYSVNSLTLNQGNAGASVTPTILGTLPITYSLTSSPQTSNITINSQGVINVSSLLQAGKYVINVIATNSAGSATFTSVYTVNINAAAISFANNIKPLVVKTCGTCHTGGGQTNYLNYSTTVRDINVIIDRIQRIPSARGYMPKNASPLTTEQINLFKQWQSQGFPQ